ncbi:hypothetical protein D3C81_1623230 [compost metagenome]
MPGQVLAHRPLQPGKTGVGAAVAGLQQRENAHRLAAGVVGARAVDQAAALVAEVVLVAPEQGALVAAIQGNAGVVQIDAGFHAEPCALQFQLCGEQAGGDLPVLVGVMGGDYRGLHQVAI